MSVRDHRDEAEGRRFRMRMPKPIDAKLGTRIHGNQEDRYDEDIPEIEKCEGCGLFAEVEDLISCEQEVAFEYFGLMICPDCRRIVETIVDEWEKEAGLGEAR